MTMRIRMSMVLTSSLSLNFIIMIKVMIISMMISEIKEMSLNMNIMRMIKVQG